MDKHADARVAITATRRVAEHYLLENGIDYAKRQHDRGRKRLWDIFQRFDESQHGRARRVACERILAAYDSQGETALKLFEQIWARAGAAKNATRYFLAAALGEISARRW